MPEFWASVAAKEQFASGIWSLPGFDLSYCRPDFMHTCCLGIVQDLAGNILWDLFKSLKGTFRQPDGACSKLLNMIKICSHELQAEAPLNNLTVFMIRGAANKKPKLKAKAAENRRLVPVLRLMLQKCFEVATPYEVKRLQCLEAMCKIYEEMASWVQGVSHIKLQKLARQHLVLYTSLSNGATDSLCWHLYPKHHLFLHVVENTINNPRLEWNYGDETAIGELVLLAQKTHVGQLPVQLMERVRETFVP